MKTIPFNKPHLFGKELQYIKEAVDSGKISGDGIFSRKCQQFFEMKYGFSKTLLTTSCTDALEMIALLCNISPGDEVIAPSFTFVSTVNTFVMRGAHIRFCDVRADYPGIDENKIEELITPRTKAIIVTHYAGIACRMDAIREIASKHNLIVIEDAAHAVDGYFNNHPLGSLGTFSAFSFHETKNVIAGEGGMIVINDQAFTERAEIIREKGTNRSKFFRGEIDRYTWVDVGSSFLPGEIVAAFLYAQLENLEQINTKRKTLWNTYYASLQGLAHEGRVGLPVIPQFAKHNGHLFYLLTAGVEERAALIQHLSARGFMAIFHYQPLHTSPFWTGRYNGPVLKNTDRYADTLLRLPMYFDLTGDEVMNICQAVNDFYAGK